MEYKIKKLKNAKTQINIVLEKSLIDELVEKKLEEIKNKLSISGFRKGKVPIQLVKSRYKSSVTNDTLSEYLEKDMKNIILKEKLKPIGEFDIKKKDDGLKYFFEVTFQNFPDIKIKNLSFSIEKPKVVLKEKNIEDIIENIRNEFGSWEQVSRKSSVGDNIEIEYLLLPGNRVEKKTL